MEQFVDDSGSEEGSISGSENSEERKEFDNRIFSKDIGVTLENYQEVNFAKTKSQDPTTKNEFIPLDEI